MILKTVILTKELRSDKIETPRKENMMKKFISLLLALVMALSLMACGNNADANDDQPPPRPWS